MQSRFNAFKYITSVLILLSSLPAQSTGIMPPDLGWFGNILVYWGIPLLTILFSILLIWLLIKWCEFPIKNITSKTVQLIKTNQKAQLFIIYLLPYLLVLAFAWSETLDNNYHLNAYVFLQALAIYVFIYLVPLLIIKYLIKIRQESERPNQNSD